MGAFLHKFSITPGGETNDGMRKWRCKNHCVKFGGDRTSPIYAGPKQQEAQLSQRNRATLRVVEYFAKSLKITQGHSK